MLIVIALQNWFVFRLLGVRSKCPIENNKAYTFIHTVCGLDFVIATAEFPQSYRQHVLVLGQYPRSYLMRTGRNRFLHVTYENGACRYGTRFVFTLCWSAQ